MDNNFKIHITNTVIEGFLFLEKVFDHLTFDLELERSNISRLFKKLLILLDQPEPQCVYSDLQSDVNYPIFAVGYDSIEETKNREFRKDVSRFFPLKRDRDLYEMSSNLPPDRYIKLFLSINTEHEGFYYCVLERGNILLGLNLDDSSPEYVLPLESFEVNRGKGSTIELKNLNFEIVMQLDSDNDCNVWLSSILNAKSALYSYIPILLQESTPRTDMTSYAIIRSDTPKVGVCERSSSESTFEPTKLNFEEFLEEINGNLSTVNIESSNLRRSKRFSKSTNSVFIDVSSLSNFEIFKEKYSNKGLNRQNNQNVNTEKVSKTFKSRKKERKFTQENKSLKKKNV